MFGKNWTVFGARVGTVPALACVLVLVAAVIDLIPTTTAALPVFARKYHTSCLTCHISPPALTPFGMAFKQNGYRFPEGQDEVMTKEEPIGLGAEGYKKLWPQAVWPDHISGAPPIAVLMESAMEYENDTSVLTFGGMGGVMEILAAGTFDEHFSFWASVEFGREDGEVVTELNRINLLVRPFTSPAFQLKFGAFEPGIMLLSNHTGMLDQKLWALVKPVGDNAWAPEGFQQGIEAYGVPWHRVIYNAGVVEGSGSLGDRSKDVYGRLGYKFGGLALDGVTTNQNQGAANPKPWSEKSVTVSAFAYHGTATPEDSTGSTVNNDFDEFGADVHVIFLDFGGHAGYTDRTDSRLYADDPSVTDAKVNNAFAEAYWVAYPWLIPSVRYEYLKVEDEKAHQASITINFLVRPNVKAFFAANWLKEQDGDFTTDVAALGVLVGF